MYPEKNMIWKDPCTPVFTAALFTIAKTWKQPKCLSTEEWLKKMWYIYIMEYSVQFSRSIVFDSLRPHELQHTRPPCPTPTPGVYTNSCPLSWWCHPMISSSVIPFSSCLQSFPTSGSFKWVSSSHQVAKILEFQLQHQSFQWTPRTDFLSDGLVGSPCSPRDSQESSPTPQFKSINSLASPTLTSIHDHWENHSLD